MRSELDLEIDRRFERACDLYNRGDVHEAFAEFSWCADRDDLRSAYRLGWMYSHGKGTDRDLDAAIHWYGKAATTRRSAAYNLGMIYRRRSLREGPESSLARQWFRRAACLGEPDAWARYGEMYVGIGNLERNDRRAFCLFLKGARAGSIHAAYRLGLAYGRGLGVRASVRDAVYWLNLAAQAGDTPSAGELGFVMAEHPDQFSAEEAVRWIMVAARRGHAVAQHNLALFFFEGRGVNQNPKAARYWFWRAAKNDDGTAQFNLAVMLKDGAGGSRSLEDAWFWARLAESNGEEGASGLVRDWEDQLNVDEVIRVDKRVTAWLDRRKCWNSGSSPWGCGG